MYGGRFLNGVSLRRCHKTADVTITVVSATHPHVRKEFKATTDADELEVVDGWFRFVKQQIESALKVGSEEEDVRENIILLGSSYDANEGLMKNGLLVYMRDSEKEWKLLYEDSLPKPGFRPTSIIVTNSEGTWPGRCVCVRSRAI
eukprot:GHVU01137927.1.p2 GENE.GHVU01137927.1~~GHVU01137927.1.p2  ORF type:complete len:146 (+),score=10.37 GHVU01137927.1:400-837(+)